MRKQRSTRVAADMRPARQMSREVRRSPRHSQMVVPRTATVKMPAMSSVTDVLPLQVKEVVHGALSRPQVQHGRQGSGQIGLGPLHRGV